MTTKHIFLDIETIPTQVKALQDYILENVKAPSNYKDPEKIEAYIKEAREDALLKASFDGGFNQIVCVSVAKDDEDPISFIGEEKKILTDLYAWIDDVKSYAMAFVGHNISGFDMRVLRQRSIVNGIKLPHFMPFDAKPWDLNPYDTMVQWDSKNSVSMDKLATILGIGGKGSVNGADVYPMWKEGRIEDVAKYCESDVLLVRKIFRKMNVV